MNDSIPSNHGERDECSSYICETIQDMNHQLDGNSGAIRYSTHTINFSSGVNGEMTTSEHLDFSVYLHLSCYPIKQLNVK